MHERAREFAETARDRHGFDPDVREFDAGTRTAEDAAAAIGCRVAQIASSLAVTDGTDVAVETADIVLVRNSPKDVTAILRLAGATYSKMVQNLWWAAGYNIFAIPVAAGVLYGWGILFGPAVGAALMSLSTVIVAINARFLNVER